METLLELEDKLAIGYWVYGYYHIKGNEYVSGTRVWVGPGVTHEQAEKNKREYYAKPLQERVDKTNTFSFTFNCKDLKSHEIQHLKDVIEEFHKNDPDIMIKYTPPKKRNFEVQREECKYLFVKHEEEFKEKMAKYQELREKFVLELKENDIYNQEADYDDPMTPKLNFPEEWYFTEQRVVCDGKINVIFHKNTKIHKLFEKWGWLIKYANEYV